MKTTISHIVKCSYKVARECKETFGDDYEMYKSYLDMYRKTTDGKNVRIIAISESEYRRL